MGAVSKRLGIIDEDTREELDSDNEERDIIKERGRQQDESAVERD